MLGDGSVLNLPSIGVVGSRRCTNYGEQVALVYVSDFVEHEICIVSGGARGVDSVAHKVALREHAKTIVVMGSGFNHIYPREHERLFQEVIQGGGLLLSEFELDEPPKPEHFPRRNRIISGLSDALLVVEAARRSGSLITARIAVEEHGIEVFAVPGRLDMPMSQGVNWLLKHGGAHLTTDPSDVREAAEQSFCNRVYQ